MTEGWWKYAKPGDKVVCVQLPTRAKYDCFACEIEVGEVYAISEIEADDFLNLSSGVGFTLAGLTHLYGANLFRPLQTKSTETGMAILKRILHGAPVKEDA